MKSTTDNSGASLEVGGGVTAALRLLPAPLRFERTVIAHPEPRAESVRRRVERVIRIIPPGSGAVVMGTGIVSIDLTLGGQERLSLVPLAVAGIAWVLLGALLAWRLLRARARFLREASLPASLTGVAGTAVLGTRLVLLGWSWAGAVMIGIAALLWLALVGQVLRHWVTPTVGTSFVLTVSTESLAVLLAALGAEGGLGWLVILALAPLSLGVGFYVFIARRFDLRQLLVGRGDHWVSGGALAISTLACGRVTQAAQSLGVLGGGREFAAPTLALWILAIAWLPALVAGELASRRVLYDTRRWSTVFPVGMYAACSFATGEASGIGAFTDFARTWTWVGLAVWAAVLVAMAWQPVPVLLGRGRQAEDMAVEAGGD